MKKLYDYTCLKCGHTEIDVLVNSDKEEVLCKMCNQIMDRQFGVISLKTTQKHHRSLEGYKPGRGNVEFKKM